MAEFTTLTSRLVPLPVENIDTDQIIPARYLKATDKNGMGDALFSDWRYNPDGSPKPDFVLNDPKYRGAQILLVGDNFGCGSSREHAPWALTGYGFRAVISTSFADIFRNNATKTGLVPVVVPDDVNDLLMRAATEEPGLQISIDIENRTLTVPEIGVEIEFPMDDFTQYRLLEGLDDIGITMRHADEISAYEATRPSWMPTITI